MAVDSRALQREGAIAMSSVMDTSRINVGDEVFGSDGGKVGEVAIVYPAYIVVEKGFFFPTDYSIPYSAIASSGGRQIFLNVTKDEALNSGWNVAPADLEAATTTATIASDDDVLTRTGVRTGDAIATGAEELRIPVIEEELTATVRPVEAGAVRIAKDVVSEDRVLDVPVTEERLRVERRIVDRAATDADAALFEETLVEVPLRTEAVDVQKEARVKEEIVISKEAVQRTERVADTVRREEVRVDDATVTDPTLIEDTGIGEPRPL
jgi:uncharacterized protein (TIGR02271 family)